MVVDHQSHNMFKNFLYIISFCLLTQLSFAAGDSSSDSSSDNYLDKYKAAKNLGLSPDLRGG